MKKMLALAVLLLPFSAFSAEGDPLVWGTYWTVTSVDTKPGKFDAYLADLKANYRRSLDMQIADGKVKSYSMFANVHARDGEPDLWLLVEWNSGADMLDTPVEYFEGLTAKIFGSLDQGESANINRGELRTIMSTSLIRQMSFSD
jgi:hypothetical protein